MREYIMADHVELPENLTVIRQAEFNGVTFDFFDDAVTNEIYMCDEQIGVALEYEPPVAKVIDLHRRHEKQIEPFSLQAFVMTLRGTKPVSREVWLYSLRGICEMCRWAKQPKVDEFLDFMWKEVEAIRREKSKPIIQQEEIIDCAAQRIAQVLFPAFAKTLSAQIIVAKARRTDRNGGRSRTSNDHARRCVVIRFTEYANRLTYSKLLRHRESTGV